MILQAKLGFLVSISIGLLTAVFTPPLADANGGVTFTNIADDPASGLQYQRARSATFAAMQQAREQSLSEPIPFDQVFPAMGDMPYNTYGQPGIALFDYDRDGDLDIYVTNGPGTPNSLFQNQLADSGQLRFIDVGEPAGVAAQEQDSMGVSFGDTDNDGDDDLLVLGRDEPNRFFENQGNGTFTEVLNSGLEGGNLSSPSAAMGDVNGDGFLDVAIANAFSHANLVACFLEAFAANQPNQLFLNQGDNTFVDVSETSGIRNTLGFEPGFDGSPTITWSVGMVDIDLDGDTDLVFGDDQCAFPQTQFGGVDRGFMHVFLNQGDGQFIDQPFVPAHQPSGSWMGLSFGDFNADGHMDIFGSNFGEYGDTSQNPSGPYRAHSSRWLLGNGDGTFSDPSFGAVASVFGWGTGAFDYDNDGDTDIVYHGSLDGNLLAIVDNPGVILQNQDGTAQFELDTTALTMDHLRRGVQAVALGDLNQDGFVDIVTASSFDVPGSAPLLPSPSMYGDERQFADVFDGLASFVEVFSPTPDGFVWNGLDLLDGSLSVEINSANNDHHWVEVTVVGSIGLTEGGRVNRSGIGAVVLFTPEGGKTVMVPIEGGSSYASQHSLTAHLGLGTAMQGTVEIRWPGGTRNRLAPVRHGERIVFPEIPCSFDGEWPNLGAYVTCVDGALGEVAGAQRARFLTSAIQAFLDHRQMER